MSHLQIEHRNPASLKPYAQNSRKHSPAQIAQIRRSIREFGFTNPILLDRDGEIIAGHGRVLAATAEGLELVPTITLAHLSPEQKRALVIADNQIALNAGWDLAKLASEVGSLSMDGFDLNLLGFKDADLAKLLSSVGLPGEGLTDENEIPPVGQEAVSAPGDVWCLGDHRIICGSAADAHTVESLFGPVIPHLMVTDPPYGVEYDAGTRRQLQSKGSKPARGKVENDDRADWRDAWALFPGDVAYVWHAGLTARDVFRSLEASSFAVRSQIVWAKSKAVVGRGDYHWQHEACFYAVREGKTSHFVGDRKQTTIWHIDTPARSETGHSTQKPVECMRRPIENNSMPGQVVYEPFAGSGTTIIAAEQTGRVCYAVEIKPAYVDVAVRRWQAFTGKTATLSETGQSFADVASDRGVNLESAND